MKLTFVLLGVFLLISAVAASGSKQKKNKYARNIPVQQVEQDEETQVNVVVQQAPRVVKQAPRVVQRQVVREVVREPEVVFVDEAPCDDVEEEVFVPAPVRRVVQRRQPVVQVVEEEEFVPAVDQVIVNVVNKKTTKPVVQQVQQNTYRKKGSGSKGKKGKKYSC